MAKDGIKSRKKWVYIGFVVFLLLAVTGIVLGLTYWPAKSGDIVKTMYSQNDPQGKVLKNFEIVIEYAEEYQDDFITNDEINYSRELKSIQNVYTSVDKAFCYYEITMESSIKNSIGRRDVKAIQSLFGDVSSNLEKMANYISEHSEEMTTFTVVLQSWESIQDYYKQLLDDYSQLFDKLSNIYNGQELSGIYGNQMMALSVKGMSTYFNIISKSFYGEESDRNSERALRVSNDLIDFTNLYGSHAYNISEFYINDEYKDLAENAGLLEEKTEGKLSFSYLIKNNYVYTSLALTTEQAIYANDAITFLRGGIEA